MFILDGYDEQKDRKNYFTKNCLDEVYTNTVKMIVSCREEALPRDRSDILGMFAASGIALRTILTAVRIAT